MTRVTDETNSPYDVEYVGFVTGDGGDALQMLQLAHQMQLRGRRVRVIVPDSPTTVEFAERAAELDVTCLRSSLLKADATGPKQSLRSMIQLARSLTAPVLHFHTGNSCLPRSATIALALTRTTRSFVTVHSPYETIEPRSFRGRFWGVSARLTLHTVITPSDHASSFQRSCGIPERQVSTIRNAIDLAKMQNGDGRRVRAELGLSPDQPLIVFTSRIEAQKRPVDAVRILSKVIDAHPDARLVFVGRGDQSDAVVAEAKLLGVERQVDAVGFRTDVADWLAASTVWLLPTERENFSVAVLEALAAGCAVVTTDCPGNDEIIVDGVNGLAFAVADVDGGAHAVRRVLDDAALRRELGAGAHSTIADYSVESMVDRHVGLYADFVPAADGTA